MNNIFRVRHLGLLLIALLLAGCPQFAEVEDNNRPIGPTPVDPGQESRECKGVIAYYGSQTAQRVTAAGEFNEWDITATELTRKDGAWTAEIELPPGHYGYKFVVDGEYEGEPPPDQYTKWVGEFENRNLIVPNCKVPSWRVLESGVSSDGLVTARLKFTSSESGEPIDPISVRVTVGDVSVEPTVDVETGTVSISYQAPTHGKYSIKAWASDTGGVRTEDSPLWIPLWHEAEEFTWQDATMYLIFTDRFRDSDGTSPLPPVEGVAPIANYMGGDFRGITDAIEEDFFDDMGVNLLWLSPVNENTNQGHYGMDGYNRYTGYHGYWTVDPLRAETRYGDAEMDADERLKELVRTAQARGIRVMFDLVLNQVHEDHIYCQEEPAFCDLTCVCGSPGCEWEGPAGRPLDCQFAPYLPDLNYRNHPLLRRVVDDVLAFMKKFDIDSVRIDAAKHMDHIIMRTIRLRLNEL
ncbi:MAG: alpha-amylase family glycosyl hydrolase, partial [Bradymonadaceae bacterium]